MAGGTGSSYYLFVPMESYGLLDRELAASAAVGGKLASPAEIAAMFTASTERVDTQVLTISPDISYVPEEFANQDKAFWKAK